MTSTTLTSPRHDLISENSLMMRCHPITYSAGDEINIIADPAGLLSLRLLLHRLLLCDLSSDCLLQHVDLLLQLWEPVDLSTPDCSVILWIVVRDLLHIDAWPSSPSPPSACLNSGYSNQIYRDQGSFGSDSNSYLLFVSDPNLWIRLDLHSLLQRHSIQHRPGFS